MILIDKAMEERSGSAVFDVSGGMVYDNIEHFKEDPVEDIPTLYSAAKKLINKWDDCDTGPGNSWDDCWEDIHEEIEHLRKMVS